MRAVEVHCNVCTLQCENWLKKSFSEQNGTIIFTWNLENASYDLVFDTYRLLRCCKSDIICA